MQAIQRNPQRVNEKQLSNPGQRSTQQQQRHPPPRLKAMDEVDSGSDAEVLDQSLLTIDAVLKLDSTIEYCQVSHREGKVSLPGASDFFLVRDVLFDTGASGDNYVSARFVDDNGLVEHLEPVEKSVKVANGSRVRISHRIQLLVKFWDKGMQPVVAKLSFNVLERRIEYTDGDWFTFYLYFLSRSLQGDAGLLCVVVY